MDAQVLRSLEQVYWDWASGKDKTGIGKVLVRLNEELKSGRDDATIQHVCNDAMALFQKIKQGEKFDLNESLTWLSSSVNGDRYPPVRHGLLVGTAPMDDQLILPEDLYEQLQSYAEMTRQDWSDNGINHMFQGSLHDCSFVTSIISLARNNTRLLLSIIAPHSYAHRYGVSLHFNGCRRLVEIGNSLPVLQEQSLFVRSAANDQLIWPALIEKAFLKIHGSGYNFQGSNAAVDTFTISGWIPEIITRNERPDLIQLWDTLYHHFQGNRVVLALGTGNYTRDYAPNHDYSISEMHLESTAIVIKNPWRRTSTMMKFQEVFDHFETIYINWNPGALLHRSLNLITGEDKTLFRSPQFHLHNCSSEASKLYLLLEKHLNFASSSINVGVYESHGEKIFTKTVPLVSNRATNSPCHVTRLALMPGQSVTVVVSNDSTSSQNFTLHCYATLDFTLNRAQPKFQHLRQVEGEWTLDSCGGNWSFQSYVKNPQYELVIPGVSPVELTLALQAQMDTLVNMQLYFEGSKFNPRSSVINEKYTSGSLIKTVTLKPGKYRLVLSTYDPDLLMSYKLIINSSARVDLQEISTRLAPFIKPFKFKWRNKNRFKVLFKANRETKLNIHMWTSESYAQYRPRIRASIFYKDGTPVMVNSEFDDSLYGIWLEDVVVDARDDVILLIERFEVGDEELQGEIGSDFQVELIK